MVESYTVLPYPSAAVPYGNPVAAPGSAGEKTLEAHPNARHVNLFTLESK